MAVPRHKRRAFSADLYRPQGIVTCVRCNEAPAVFEDPEQLCLQCDEDVMAELIMWERRDPLEIIEGVLS